MNNPGPVLARLRAATAAAHQRLERDLDAVATLKALAARERLLPRYYRMHASAEGAIWPWLDQLADLHLAERRRTPAILDDLKTLRLATPASVPPFTLAGGSEALGALYVLEGSTLGGRMIYKALGSSGYSLAGLSFLDPYGSSAGSLWRSFVAVLEREGAADSAAVERGGVLGFEHAHACLVLPELGG